MIKKITAELFLRSDYCEAESDMDNSVIFTASAKNLDEFKRKARIEYPNVFHFLVHKVERVDADV